MKNIVITIVEEEASGGREIGEKLAKILNIPYYEKDIIKKASKESGIAKNIFDGIEKNGIKSFLSYIPIDFALNGGVPFFGDFIPIQDKVFLAKNKAVREITKNHSCVVFCKAAREMIKNREGIFNIFIYSDDEKRVENIKKIKNIEVKEGFKILKKKDKATAKYYSYYTGIKWDDRKQYDLMLNTKNIGILSAVELIKGVLKNDFK